MTAEHTTSRFAVEVLCCVMCCAALRPSCSMQGDSVVETEGGPLRAGWRYPVRWSSGLRQVDAQFRGVGGGVGGGARRSPGMAGPSREAGQSGSGSGSGVKDLAQGVGVVAGGGDLVRGPGLLCGASRVTVRPATPVSARSRCTPTISPPAPSSASGSSSERMPWMLVFDGGTRGLRPDSGTRAPPRADAAQVGQRTPRWRSPLGAGELGRHRNGHYCRQPVPDAARCSGISRRKSCRLRSRP